MTKQYKKIYKKHKKDIKQKALCAYKNPWDWQPGIECLVAHLEYMRDVYIDKSSIMAKENFEWDPKAIKKSRLEMIEEILAAYHNWVECEDKYFKVIDEPGNNDNKGIFKYHIEYLLGDREETYKAFKKEYNDSRKLFFNLLNKYIEELWD